MIVFDLECRGLGHRFEGWFGSSNDFADQQARGLLCCPQCGSADVAKAPMAPAVPAKGNQRSDTRPAAGPVAGPRPVAGPVSGPIAGPIAGRDVMPAEALRMMQTLEKMQAEALKTSRWVGDRFAENARAIHYGEREGESIHGQATPDEARDLIEEGIEVAPLPFPVAPPGKAN